ncbi:MAG: indole-3-glycerol-phosphate synthase [Candidatus Altiarchaeota archaeon]
MNFFERVVRETLKDVKSKKVDTAYVYEIEERLNAFREPLGLAKAPLGNSIIAEVKFASPSGGEISKVGVEEVVRDYVDGGAAALSILTEEEYFKGSLDFLERARSIASIPILRKDFILDGFQIKEARAFGADGVLLIAGLLGDRLEEMINAAHSFGLWALVETHNEDDIQEALDAGARIIGINNRDLGSMEVELGTTIKLCELIPKDKTLVAESGISTPEDIKKLKKECKRIPDFYLIGTSLMKTKNRGKKLRDFLRA